MEITQSKQQKEKKSYGWKLPKLKEIDILVK